MSSRSYFMSHCFGKTHSNPWGRLKWPYAITRLTAHFMCGLMSDLLHCEFKEYDVLYDAESPYWDQASLSNIKLKQQLKFVWIIMPCLEYKVVVWDMFSPSPLFIDLTITRWTFYSHTSVNVLPQYWQMPSYDVSFTSLPMSSRSYFMHSGWQIRPGK